MYGNPSNNGAVRRRTVSWRGAVGASVVDAPTVHYGASLARACLMVLHAVAAERGGSESLAERGADASIVIVASCPGVARWSCPQLMVLRPTSQVSRAAHIR